MDRLDVALFPRVNFIRTRGRPCSTKESPFLSRERRKARTGRWRRRGVEGKVEEGTELRQKVANHSARPD